MFKYINRPIKMTAPGEYEEIPSGQEEGADAKKSSSYQTQAPYQIIPSDPPQIEFPDGTRQVIQPHESAQGLYQNWLRGEQEIQPLGLEPHLKPGENPLRTMEYDNERDGAENHTYKTIGLPEDKQLHPIREQYLKDRLEELDRQKRRQDMQDDFTTRMYGKKDLTQEKEMMLQELSGKREKGSSIKRVPTREPFSYQKTTQNLANNTSDNTPKQSTSESSPSNKESPLTKENSSGKSRIESIEFDGSTLITTAIDQNGNKITQTLPGVSGRPVNGKFDLSPEHQQQAGKGPIPEGNYSINPNKIDRPTQADNIIGTAGGISSALGGPKFGKYPGGQTAWGSCRTDINQTPEQQAQTGRGGFFIHGGKVAGSAGCIDLTNKDTDFCNFLEKYRAPDQTEVPLRIRYPQKK